MFSCVTLLILIFVAKVNSTWMLGDQSLFWSVSDMATGYYNNSIWLIGGTSNNYRVTEFVIDDNNPSQSSLSIYGATTAETNISQSLQGGGQYYTQINNDMWFLKGSRFAKYSLDTKQFVYYFSIAIPNYIAFSGGGCLASQTDFIFVVGGVDSSSMGNELTATRIYKISTNTWISSVPSMDQKRTNLACIIHPTTNKLYAIGGRSYSVEQKPAVQSIELLDIQNVETTISGKTWEYNPNDLLISNAGGRAVIYKQYILLIGGIDNNVDIRQEVQSIDTTNGNVAISTECGGLLSIPWVYSSSIIVNNVIYTFGGREASGSTSKTIDKWQYCDTRITEIPTSSPLNPTSNPTSTPTVFPSTVPSSNPTLFPSLPTSNPSSYPTTNPSSDPTSNPTQEPTFNPSVEPTFDPTLEPTNNPSHNPSHNPSQNPSITKATTAKPQVYGYKVAVEIVFEFDFNENETLNETLNDVKNILNQVIVTKITELINDGDGGNTFCISFDFEAKIYDLRNNKAMTNVTISVCDKTVQKELSDEFRLDLAADFIQTINDDTFIEAKFETVEIKIDELEVLVYISSTTEYTESSDDDLETKNITFWNGSGGIIIYIFIGMLLIIFLIVIIYKKRKKNETPSDTMTTIPVSTPNEGENEKISSIPMTHRVLSETDNDEKDDHDVDEELYEDHTTKGGEYENDTGSEKNEDLYHNVHHDDDDTDNDKDEDLYDNKLNDTKGADYDIENKNDENDESVDEDLYDEQPTTPMDEAIANLP